MSLVVAWLLFPALALAVGTGCGLLLERAAGERMPGTLLPSVGLALVIVVATLATRRDLTAELASPAVLALAVAGWALGWRRLRGVRLDGWAVAAGAGLFAVLAAPVVLTGQATFLGYFMQNDTAIYFALVDHVMTHGRDLSGLPPSTSSAYLDSYIKTNYPLGTFVGLGALRPFTGQDVAWIYQPWLALLLALNGTALYEILRRAVPSAPLRAATAFLAGQAALLYAYYLQATGKETAAAWVLAVTVALAFSTLDGRRTWRSALPLAVVVAAGVDILNLAVAPWLLPPLAAFAAGLWWLRPRTGPRAAWLAPLAALVVAVVVLTGPVLLGAKTFLDTANVVLTNNDAFGNLLRPLEWWQVLGVWPKGDYRLPVDSHTQLAFALMGIVIAAAALGAVWAVRRRALAPLVFMGTALVAGVYLTRRGSPYADGKTLAIAAPAVVLAAMLGAAALVSAGRRVEGWLLAAVIAGGVLWTNALQYSSASPAPRTRLSELNSIDKRFAGPGTTLYLPVEEFAAHFLRRTHSFTGNFAQIPESRPGLPPRPAGWMNVRWDVNDLSLPFLERHRLIVAGRTPLAARPPANYRLVRRGRYYDVWERRSSPQVLAHEPVGAMSRRYAVSLAQAGSVAGCGQLASLAARARREGGRLAYVERADVPVLSPHVMARPAEWPPFEGDPLSVTIYGPPGTAAGAVEVPRAGRYEVWVQGRFDRALSVDVAGRRVGKAGPRELGPAGQAFRIGALDLPPGQTRIVVTRPDNDLAPGDAGTSRLLGPVILQPADDAQRVAEAAPDDYRRLCGRRLDWVEVVR